jgi:type I restriction enzyme, S subunit
MSSVVPEGWSVYALGDICRVKGGKRLPKGSAFSETITPFPYIRVADFESGSIETRGIKYVSTNVREQIKRYTISSSDIYISIAGSIGLVGIVPRVFNGALLTENAAKIVLNDEYLDRTYLCLFLSSEIAQSQFKQEIGTGGGVPKLALFRIEQTVLSVPPFPEQQKIASILTSVDEVIENTQKQIDKLQDLKKATMNELLTKGIGHTEFKDSELGRIPKSWEIKKLQDIGQCIRGLTYAPENIVENGLLVLRSSNVQDGRLSFNDNVFVNIKVDDHFLSQDGDILICVRNGSRHLLGKSALVIGNRPQSTHGAFMIIFRTENYEFVRFLIQSDWFLTQVSRDVGATINSINNSNLLKYRFAFPPLDEQLKISNIMNSIERRIDSKKQKFAQTQSLKKSLMQDLLTGKVRVSVN